MISNRAVASLGLVTLTVAALVSGGLEACMWVGGICAVGFAMLNAMFDA